MTNTPLNTTQTGHLSLAVKEVLTYKENDMLNMKPHLTQEQMKNMYIAMNIIAHVDGMTPQEKTLIDNFFPDMKDEGSASFDPSVFDSAENREILIQTLCLCAYADGKMSMAEFAMLKKLLMPAGVSEQEIKDGVDAVKQMLLTMVSDVSIESITKVIGEMNNG